MQKSKTIIDLLYWPPVSFFSTIKNADILEICENDAYIKQSFRNRTSILTAQKVVNLIVPVHASSKKTPFKEVKIDYQQSWLREHQRTIISAYGRAPFFEHFWPLVEGIYAKKSKYLIDLNQNILTLCLELIGISCNIFRNNFCTNKSNIGIFDLREVFVPKNAIQSKKYFQPYPYIQVFGKNFVEDLSIIDLLFCEGPNSGTIIDRSYKGHNN